MTWYEMAASVPADEQNPGATAFPPALWTQPIDQVGQPSDNASMGVLLEGIGMKVHIDCVMALVVQESGCWLDELNPCAFYGLRRNQWKLALILNL